MQGREKCPPLILAFEWLQGCQIALRDGQLRAPKANKQYGEGREWSKCGELVVEEEWVTDTVRSFLDLSWGRFSSA